LLIGQLPLVDVCDETDPDDVVPDDAVELEEFDDLVFDEVAAVESSDPVSFSPLEPDAAEVLFVVWVLAAAVWVVVAAWLSCQARTPPSESMAATLNAAADLRARAARGLRRGRGVAEVVLRARAGGAGGVGWEGEVGVCSSMATNLQMPRESVARGG
jgi:hypothetical protein